MLKQKPTVEQALLFKRLSEKDWFGVPDHVIKECLFETSYDIDEAYKHLQRHFIPPQPDYWCPRWGYRSSQLIEGEEPIYDADSVKWYLVKINGETVIPLDAEFKSINDTGTKMEPYWSLREDGKFGDREGDPPSGYLERDTNGTEGHPYNTFLEAEEAMKCSGDPDIFLQVPDGRRFKKTQHE